MDDIHKRLEALQEEVLKALSNQNLNEETLKTLRVQFLGRNGRLTQILHHLKDLSQNDRPKIGQMANLIKVKLEESFKSRFLELKELKSKRELLEQRVDMSLPERPVERGHLHPITQTLADVVGIFTQYGFQIAEGPEIETNYYNFDALNTPVDHPARDLQDTFYISDNLVLRTHTSPVQIRVMEKIKPPIRIIVPGVVYRHDYDVSHTPMFHQVEGLLVDTYVSMAHLKGTLTTFIHKLFSKETRVRFRPSYFPFTEPSAELDISCVLCEGKGCRVCKESGWLEVLGCGMVHPEVLRNVKLDPKKFSGFAFGMGIERLTMLRYGISDIRLFFENDLRFLEQF